MVWCGARQDRSRINYCNPKVCIGYLISGDTYVGLTLSMRDLIKIMSDLGVNIV